MSFSDEDLMLLEQLTYLDKDILENAGFSNYEITALYNDKKCKSVSDMMDILDKHIDDLEIIGTITDSKGNKAPCQGKELAAAFREIEKNPDLMNLEIADIAPYKRPDGTGHDKINAIVFYDEKNPDDPAIVCFRGTLGPEEWEDNLELLETGDTEANKKALDYVDGLDFQNITLVGHSKGANKAAYIFYLADKLNGKEINKCVVMDCPGFSRSFYDEHRTEVDSALQRGEISSYAVSGDYVNIMLEVEGTDTKYCVGHGMDGFVENHSWNSFFDFRYDTQNGYRIHLYRNPDGSLLTYTEQDEKMKFLHDFTLFVDKHVDNYGKRKEVSEFLGHYIAAFLADDYIFEEDGIFYSKNGDKNSESLKEYAKKHSDETRVIFDMFLGYCMENYTEDSIVAKLGLQYIDPLWIFCNGVVGLNYFINGVIKGDMSDYFAYLVRTNPLVKLSSEFNQLLSNNVSRGFNFGTSPSVSYVNNQQYSNSLDTIPSETSMTEQQMKKVMYSQLSKYTTPSNIPSSEEVMRSTLEKQMPKVQFGEDNTNATEAVSNNVIIGKGGAHGSAASAVSAMSNSMFATIDKDTMYVDVAEFERHRKDIYNAADKLIFNAKPAFEKEAGICGTESVCLLTEYWHKVIDTTDRFREFKMGPADLLMRNTLKSLLDVDAESAETIKVQGGNSETHTG